MKLKLGGSFGSVRNIVPVMVEGNGAVGDVHKHRRSGWRGGPSYQFHPNEQGAALGLKVQTGASVREILAALA